MALEGIKEYRRPTGMAEALALLERESPRTVPLAGGAYLAIQRDQGIEAVVDLSALGLDGIEANGGEIRIGAMLRLETLATGGVPGRSGEALAQVARRQGWQLRCGSTLGGALVTGALPELDALLWAMEARVSLAGAQDGTFDFAGFLEQREHLPPATLLTGVILPMPATNEGLGAARVSRTPADFPTAAATAWLERRGDRISTTRLVLIGAAAGPLRMSALEQALAGRRWTDTLPELATQAIAEIGTPPADIRGGSEYRRAMLGVCASEALIAAWNDSAG